MAKSLKYVEKFTEVESEEVSTNNEAHKTKKRTRKQRDWLFQQKYPTAQEAEDAVNGEECWSKVVRHPSSEGVKVIYRCNKAKKDQPCSKGLFILYHSDSQQVKYKIN